MAQTAQKNIFTKNRNLSFNPNLSQSLSGLLPKGKTLSIEVGDRLTKVCVSVSGGGRRSVRNSFLFQTPEKAVEDGQIVAPDVFAAALREQLGAHGLKGVRNAAFTVTSSKIATREVKLPPIRDNRLKDIVQTNASDYFPVDLSKYHVAHCLLERVEKGGDAGCRVLVFAVPLQLLQSYFQMAEKAGLRVRSIDYSGNSQYQLLRLLDDGQATLYVNLESDSTCITFLKDEKLLFQRTFTFGGDEVVRDYMDAAGKPDYLTALAEACGAGKPQLPESLSHLVENIIRSANYFNSSHWEHPMERMVLLGPYSRLAGLRELLEKGTGVDISYIGNDQAARFFAHAADFSAYLSCVGSVFSPLDLIPQQFRAENRLLRKHSEKSDQNSVRDGAVILGICLAAALAISAAGLLRYHSALADKAAMQKEIKALSYTEGVYKSYALYKANEGSLVTLAGTVQSPNDSLTAFFSELEAKMPSKILLLSAACDQNGVTMNITVPDYNEVAMVLVQLRSFQSIRNIQISSVDKETDQSNGSYVKFSLTCEYGVNPYLNGVNPYASKANAKGQASTGASQAPGPASGTAH